MIYVFDTSAFDALFKNYYRSTFPSLWQRFDQMVADGRVISTREVFREIEDNPVERLREWAVQYRHLFAIPTSAEGAFVARIYRQAHFQQNIEQKKLLKGGKNADPFVIAKASIDKCSVVTNEHLKPNAVKIPNICKHFDIRCLSLEEFMQEEEWTF